MAESILGIKRTKRCGEFNESDIGKEVSAMGWVQKCRNKGGLIFINLRDRTDIIQIVFDEKTCDKIMFDKALEVKFEYVLTVVNKMQKQSDINEKLSTGTIEIIPSELRILSTSDVLPFPIEDEISTREELRLEYRYLDLRRRPLQYTMKLRSKVSIAVRKFLSCNGLLR